MVVEGQLPVLVLEAKCEKKDSETSTHQGTCTKADYRVIHDGEIAGKTQRHPNPVQTSEEGPTMKNMFTWFRKPKPGLPGPPPFLPGTILKHPCGLYTFVKPNGDWFSCPSPLRVITSIRDEDFRALCIHETNLWKPVSKRNNHGTQETPE